MGYDVQKSAESVRNRLGRLLVAVFTGTATAAVMLVGPVAPASADDQAPPAAGKPLPLNLRDKANAEIESGGGCPAPDSRDLTVTKVVYQVAMERKVSPKVLLAGFEAGWIESHMNNMNCGDRDSLGVFQQRPSQGWGTPAQVRDVTYASNKFFARAQENEKKDSSLTAGKLAQSVQISAYPDRYDDSQLTAQVMIAEAKQLIKPAEPLAFRDLAGVGDFNGDKVPDLVAIDTRVNGGELYLYPAVVGGGFTARKRLTSGWNGMREVVGIGSMTADGAPDVLAIQKASGKLFRWNGQRWNTALSAGKIASSDNWSKMTNLSPAGDVTGDGVADLFATETGTGKLYLYPGTSSGTFGQRRDSGATKGLAWLAGIGDLNFDGTVDQLSVNSVGKTYLHSGQLRNAMALAQGKELKVDGKQLRDVTGVGDFDADGVSDVVAIDKSNGHLLLDSGTTADGGGFGDPKVISNGWN